MLVQAINFEAFKGLPELFPVNERPFSERQKQRLWLQKPYKGLKILHNIPLTLETLTKVENLLLGGADVTVTSPSFMEPHPQALAILQQANVRVQLSQYMHEQYDICMDCAGELYGKVHPRIGTSEITGTGTLKYGSVPLEYPVISIDMCAVKKLEGVLGTGEAFVRAFKQLASDNIYQKSFLIFGYGKVGRGMAHALKGYTNNIVVVDAQTTNLEQAKAAGFTAYNAKNVKDIENSAANAFAIATATGIKNVISNNYNPYVFKGKFLANMGGEDEFGYCFNEREVLCAKKPINFFIDKPTLMRYLDPVFYAHNMAIDILLQKPTKKPGLHPFPANIADKIVREWQSIFNENTHI